MPSIRPRNPERASDRRLPCAIGRSPVPERRNRSNRLDTRPFARSDIYTRPDVYDMEYEGSSNEDARFFARLLARIRARRVLELACGSCRVVFTLARALPAAEIVVVDSSIDMIERAAAARDATEACVRERVSIVKGDMRDWPGSVEPFDAVVIGCCSVSHLLTLDDRRRTWATAFRLLRPGGIFILDVRVPDLATLAEAQRIRPRAFVDLDIDARRSSVGKKRDCCDAPRPATSRICSAPTCACSTTGLTNARWPNAWWQTSPATFISRPSSNCCSCPQDSRSRSNTATIGSCRPVRRNMSSP